MVDPPLHFAGFRLKWIILGQLGMCIGQLSIIVTHTRNNHLLRKKGLFWPMALEVPAHGSLAQLLLVLCWDRTLRQGLSQSNKVFISACSLSVHTRAHRSPNISSKDMSSPLNSITGNGPSLLTHGPPGTLRIQTIGGFSLASVTRSNRDKRHWQDLDSCQEKLL